jgi:hypothetical protein
VMAEIVTGPPNGSLAPRLPAMAGATELMVTIASLNGAGRHTAAASA